MSCAAIAIGGSAGGIDALAVILGALPGDFAPSLLVVQHLHPSDGGALAHRLAELARLPVSEALDKAAVEPGRVYTAPANYHLLVEREHTLALSVDGKVNWSRPAIDPLFDSAARAYGATLVAVLLSGASSDGARGLGLVRELGGHTIAQDPAGAPSPTMPRAAIAAGAAEEVLAPAAIAARLIELAGTGSTHRRRQP